MFTQCVLSTSIYYDHMGVKSDVREGYSGEWKKQNLREGERENGEGLNDFATSIIRCLCLIVNKTLFLLNESGNTSFTQHYNIN